MLNAFSVDVEDFYQVSAYEKFIPRETWHEYPQRILESTHRILDLLAESGVYATFFVMGWVGKHHPQLVTDISEAGHEIGLHSSSHRLIYQMTPEEFRQDTHDGLCTLQNILGKPVRAYRAPSFSIITESLWALEILAEEGFLYDSSIFPVHHDRYGIPGARTDIHSICTPAGNLWEFPPSVLRFSGLNLPVSGGGYFRLYPYSFSRCALRSINRKEKRPFIFYVHPWEIDPEQPIIPFGSRVTRFRHRVGLKRNYKKLTRLMKDFLFAPMGKVIQEQENFSVTSKSSS